MVGVGAGTGTGLGRWSPAFAGAYDVMKVDIAGQSAGVDKDAIAKDNGALLNAAAGDDAGVADAGAIGIIGGLNPEAVGLGVVGHSWGAGCLRCVPALAIPVDLVGSAAAFAHGFADEFDEEVDNKPDDAQGKDEDNKEADQQFGDSAR